MTTGTVSSGDTTERATASRFGGVCAVIVFAVVMLGGALPIPLYSLWAAEYGFGPLTTTVIFVAYVIGVVASLVFLGPMSDRSGRRPMLGIAVVIAAFSTLLFAVAPNVPVLLAARFLSGVATGIATSTATAAISELLASKRAASAVSTAANLGGIGIGAIIGGVFGESVPNPTRSVFWAYLLMLGASAVILWWLPETVSSRASLRLSPRWPVLAAGAGKKPFIGASLIVAAAFGVNGFFSSLAPTFLRDQLHIQNLALSGLTVGLLFVAALAAQLFVPASVLSSAVSSLVVLLAGVTVLLIALQTASLPAFLAATVTSGAGVGLTFRRGLLVTSRYANPRRRADLDASYFLIAYLGLIAPTLTLGVLDQIIGQGFATAILVTIVVATAAAGLVLTGFRPIPALTPNRTRRITMTTPANAEAGFTHEFRDVDGLRLHALVGGKPDGKPLVLLAGFPQDARAWLRTARYLSDRFKLIIPELPGQGQSERPDSGYDTQTMATRIHALLQQLGLKRYSMVAHDVGAWTAFPYGLLWGDEIENLALLDAGIPGITLPESVPLDPDRAWKTWHFAFHQVQGLPEVLLQGREREYIAWFLGTKTHDSGTFSDADIDAYADSFAAEGGIRAGLAYYREAARSAAQNHSLLETRRFIMPVLGVSAQFGSIPDMTAPVRPYADEAHNVTIPNSGHFIPDEQPALLAEALLAFLDK